MDTPTIFVAFGVTGDLMKSKILPALFALYSKNNLPERFALFGVSRKEWSHADLRSYIEKILQSVPHEEKLLLSFLQVCFFVHGDATEKNVYELLSESCEALETTWGITANKLLYLSLSPSLYKEAFEQLRHARFVQDTKGVRLMIEKPFGTSGKSADKLNQILHTTFDERSIFRVDHYLAKQSLQQLPIFDRSRLSSIHISFFEIEGVENRGALFDVIGSLRDVGQNHMLEVLAHILKKHSRADALEMLPLLTPTQLPQAVVRGQYVGYKEVMGVEHDSQTETYFKVTTTLTTSGFQDVHIVLEGGKQMKTNTKELRVTYTDKSAHSYPLSEPQSQTEYETLIQDCMHGNQTLFVSRREIAALWRFIDPILEYWNTSKTPLIPYTPHSDSVF